MVNIEGRKSSYLLNDMRNFNEIFRKDAAYNYIKGHTKPGFHPLSRKHIFEKNKGAVKFYSQKYIVNISKLVKTKTILYLIGIKFNKAMRLLVLIIPKMSGYVKIFKVQEGDK